MIVVDDMHTRKALMAKKSDAFIAMPGGFGTFEELFEVITWAQLGIHTKPIACLNVNGYFDALGALIDNAIRSGFISEEARGLVFIESDPVTLVEKLLTYSPPAPEIQWISESQT